MKKYNDSPRAQARRVMSGGTPYKRRRKKAPLRKSKDERKQEYGAYLQSDRWKEKRDRIIKKAGENVVSAENPSPRYITRPTNDVAGKKMLTSPPSVITPRYATPQVWRSERKAEVR